MHLVILINILIEIGIDMSSKIIDLPSANIRMHRTKRGLQISTILLAARLADVNLLTFGFSLVLQRERNPQYQVKRDLLSAWVFV